MSESADTDTDGEKFTTRLVMALATELVEINEHWKQACILFETLATARDVKVELHS